MSRNPTHSLSRRRNDPTEVNKLIDTDDVGSASTPPSDSPHLADESRPKRPKARHVPRTDAAEPRVRHNRVLTVDDVAEMLHLKPTTIYRMVGERRIAFLKLGNRVRFLEEDIVRWLHENRVPSLGEDK